MNNNTNTETVSTEQAQALEEIAQLREEINNCDNQIILDLIGRLALVKKIGEIKSKVGLAVHDPDREAKQFAHYVSMAQFYNVPPEQILEPFRVIVLWSRFAQRNGFRSLDDLRRRRPPGKIPKI